MLWQPCCCAAGKCLRKNAHLLLQVQHCLEMVFRMVAYVGPQALRECQEVPSLPAPHEHGGCRACTCSFLGGVICPYSMLSSSGCSVNVDSLPLAQEHASGGAVIPALPLVKP